MILKGNQRGGAKALALHLLKDENEHVEVHRLRGFCSRNLTGALNEAYAISRGTRCKQFLFSLSLNPPPQEKVSTEAFEAAIETVERELGLTGQPCAIVFHEKEGRRHAHAVWSRIDTENMRAVQLSFTRRKLQAVSRELFLEHGWKMPRGLAVSEERDPLNFTLEEWQHSKRIGKDVRRLKAAVQDAWAISDSKAALVNALEERGFKLAQGDSRGFVLLDRDGDIYSLPRWAGVKIKQVRERLGDEASLPSVATVKKDIASDMLKAMDRIKDELQAQTQTKGREFERRRVQLVRRQRAERQALRQAIETRAVKEAVARQGRFRKGLKGLWDRLRGEHKRLEQQNRRDAEMATIRDRAELDRLVHNHLEQRQGLAADRMLFTQRHTEQSLEIETDVQRYSEMGNQSLQAQHDAIMQGKRRDKPQRSRRRNGPERSP